MQLRLNEVVDWVSDEFGMNGGRNGRFGGGFESPIGIIGGVARGLHPEQEAGSFQDRQHGAMITEEEGEVD